MNKKAEEAHIKLQAELFDTVYLPRFKQACAQKGITFDSDEELVAGLETCAMLKAAEAEMRKQGIETRPSLKKQARDMLKQAMFGASEEPAAAELTGVKSALAELIAASNEATK